MHAARADCYGLGMGARASEGGCLGMAVPQWLYDCCCCLPCLGMMDGDGCRSRCGVLALHAATAAALCCMGGGRRMGVQNNVCAICWGSGGGVLSHGWERQCMESYRVGTCADESCSGAQRQASDGTTSNQLPMHLWKVRSVVTCADESCSGAQRQVSDPPLPISSQCIFAK